MPPSHDVFVVATGWPAGPEVDAVIAARAAELMLTERRSVMRAEGVIVTPA